MIIDEIATFLLTQNLGLTLGTNFFKGYLPDETDNAVVIYDTGGAEPDRDIPTGDPTFQILVRNTDYETGHALVKAISDILHQKRNFTLESTYYYYIYLMGEPGSIGRDAKNRDEFSVNFHAKIRR